MSVHSPESMWDDAPASDADLRSVQKTLWDVDPSDLETLTSSTTNGAAAAAGAVAQEQPGELLKVYLRMRPLTTTEQEAQKDDAAFLTVGPPRPSSRSLPLSSLSSFPHSWAQARAQHMATVSYFLSAVHSWSALDGCADLGLESFHL
jgi:hypothetical protein